jgi:hypothetical protein
VGASVREVVNATLNAESVGTGSKATSTTAAYLSATPSTFTGGMFITNASDAIGIWYRVGAVAAVGGATSAFLPPYASAPLAWGDVSTVSVIAVSGTPYVTWTGSTLQ